MKYTFWISVLVHLSCYPRLFASQVLDCSSWAQDLKISNVDAALISAENLPAGASATIGGGQGIRCQNTTTTSVDVCRLVFNITTSFRSSTYSEIWLPSGQDMPWNNRTVATGNAGLNGCVDFSNIAYLAGMGFAAFGDNGGHDGDPGDGSAFFENTEVILDYAYRARHLTVLLGKQVTQQYYSRQASYSYYFGCSTAGRQGLKSAQMFPEDFDGIIAGAPAIDLNHLTSFSGHFVTLTGVNASDPRFLTFDQWAAVHDEVLAQCDSLDGVIDGILEDSSICNFNPETMLCSRIGESNSSTCLSLTQVQTVRAVFSPLYGVNKTFIYPRLSPGAEISAAFPSPGSYLDGNLLGPATAWYQNAIYNDRSWDPLTLNALDIAYADSLDAQHGNVSSWSGDLTNFRDRGGKLISYHGGADGIISGENSLRYYRHVADTMRATPSELDFFYRLFPISGMGHCMGGNGAWAFGQGVLASNASTDLMATLVEWVEGGQAPDRLLGTKFLNDTSSLGIDFERAHCKYPTRTTYIGGDPKLKESWGCKFIDDWNLCGGPNSRLPKLC